MKKFLLLAMALFLVGCEKNVDPEGKDPVDENPVVENPVDETPVDETPVVEEPTDEVAPVVTVLENPVVYGTEFNVMEYITIEDESEFEVTADDLSVIDFTTPGEYVYTVTVTDAFDNATEVQVTITIPDRISLRAYLDISDYSNDYTITSSGLNVYIDKEDIGITYVNAEEFIEALKGAVIPLNVEKTEVLKVSYTYEHDEDEDEEDFTYYMEFNAEENTVYFNDVDFLDILDESTETDYSQGLKVVYSEVSDTDFSKLIDLDDYNMNIELVDGNYYMPMFLANFFLTGFGVEIYELDTELLLTDYRTWDEAEGVYDAWEDRNPVDLELVADDTYNFLALWFDVMYGLKDFAGIEDIYALLDQYPAINDGSSTNKFYKAINQFINDLDDLHSRFNNAGFRFGGYQPSSNYYTPGTELWDYINTFDAYYCSYSDPTVELNVIDGIAFVTVNGYDLDFPEQFDPIMEEASQYDHIVFDLTCNGGGLVSSAISMLTYMTDEPVYIYETDPYTGAVYTSGYQSEESNFVDANYYVFASQATFSAANLFVSAAKDNNLAVIIGDRSLGGACAVQNVVSPDGALFTNSSNYAYSNSLGEVIEDGVEPDFFVNARYEGKTWQETVAEIINNEYK